MQDKKQQDTVPDPIPNKIWRLANNFPLQQFEESKERTVVTRKFYKCPTHMLTADYVNLSQNTNINWQA